jgi:hypothetical protein
MIFHVNWYIVFNISWCRSCLSLKVCFYFKELSWILVEIISKLCVVFYVFFRTFSFDVMVMCVLSGCLWFHMQLLLVVHTY